MSDRPERYCTTCGGGLMSHKGPHGQFCELNIHSSFISDDISGTLSSDGVSSYHQGKYVQSHTCQDQGQ